ncbi:MAG TPA: isoprenylcysteine carboxylmethyltransferase family protein, partial [Methanothrix sp.]|nr:isoprenylcysteine carboxylmethyltransferase family protein [Methanothrix sp.]
VFSGFMQLNGIIVFAAGIALREWAIFVLGKHFTVRVQIREEAKLVTWGPYRYIRHPSYTGTLLSMVGIAIAVGTWFGMLFALALKLSAYRYRINIEERALEKFFGSEWSDYKKRTWRLIPGF